MINALKHRYGWLSTVLRTNLGKIIAIRINSSPRFRHILMKEGGVVPNAPNRLSTELGNLDQHNLRAMVSLNQIAKIAEKRDMELHVLLIPQNFLVGDVKN